MRNIQSDLPLATPRAWVCPAATVGTPVALGYMAITGGGATTMDAATHLLTIQLTDTAQYGNLKVGDTFVLNAGTDEDLINRTFVVASVNTSTGVVTCLIPETKSVLTTVPTYLVSTGRFRNLTALPFSARGTANGGTVYLGPNSTAGGNWYPVDPSYIGGVQYSAVLGCAITLDSLYLETTSSGDRLYLLFH